jgi:hypothetical protein
VGRHFRDDKTTMLQNAWQTPPPEIGDEAGMQRRVTRGEPSVSMIH